MGRKSRMRIVSQDRKSSINFDHYEIWVQGEAVYRRTKGENALLGVYATPQRAEEVFEDIHKAYAPVYSISDKLTDEEITNMIMPSKNVAANNITNVSDVCLTTYDNYVYYMPKK